MLNYKEMNNASKVMDIDNFGALLTNFKDFNNRKSEIFNEMGFTDNAYTKINKIASYYESIEEKILSRCGLKKELLS